MREMLEQESKKMTTRPTYKTVTVNLLKRAQFDYLLSVLAQVPLDETNPLEVVIREPVSHRSSEANRYYWHLLGEIAEQAIMRGRKFEADDWHEHCGRVVMPDTIITKDGEERSKWIELPDGSVRVISTTRLERACFAEYTQAVEAYGSSLGVLFSALKR